MPFFDSLEEEVVINTVIGPLDIKAGDIHSDIVILASIKEVPQADNMIPGAFTWSEPGLVDELGLGYSVSSDSSHHHILKDSYECRLDRKATEIFIGSGDFTL